LNRLPVTIFNVVLCLLLFTTFLIEIISSFDYGTKLRKILQGAFRLNTTRSQRELERRTIPSSIEASFDAVERAFDKSTEELGTYSFAKRSSTLV